MFVDFPRQHIRQWLVGYAVTFYAAQKMCPLVNVCTAGPPMFEDNGTTLTVIRTKSFQNVPMRV